MACEEFQDRMLDALYGEGDAAGVRGFEIHARECAACREEMGALRGVRRDLRQWAIPAGPSRSAGSAVQKARSWLPLAAGLALAAAGGLALAASQKRVDTLATALHEQERRHHAEMQELKATVAASRLDEDDAPWQDVRRLIRESEARQAIALDASLRGLAERSDARRREDLAQVSAGFSYLEGRTGLQVARTTELMGHVLQAAQKK